MKRETYARLARSKTGRAKLPLPSKRGLIRGRGSAPKDVAALRKVLRRVYR